MHIMVTCRSLILTPDNELLLVRRSQTDDRHPGVWEIPGGRAEDGESTTDVVIRETQEEVGITLTHPKLIYGISSKRPEGTGTWLFFAERVADKNVHITLSHEHDDYTWVRFDEFIARTEYSVLKDMYTFVRDNGLLEVV